MSVEQFANTAQSTLSGSISDSDTNLTVASAVSFPAVPQFRLLIDSEILLVTSVAGAVFTVSRAQEGTSAAAHSDGAAVAHVLTKGAMDKRVEDEHYADAYASRLTPAKAGRLFLPNDGFTLDRDNGSAYAPWGPLFPMTPPVDGGFAWINQGGASVSASKGGIFLNAPASGGSSSMRIRKKAAPATPYTITACMTGLILPANFAVFGLCWRQSSDGKLIVWRMGYNFGLKLEVVKWNSPTSFNSNYLTDADGPGANKPRFLRIADDGTNRVCSFSHDGQNFRQAHSVSRTDFMTADEVGFFVDAAHASNPAGLLLQSWKES